MRIVKVGGGEGIRYESVCDDLATLVSAAEPIVLVHGGSHFTNELADALGHPPKFVTSPSGFTSRFTDARTLEIFTMAYCGRANKHIVQLLQQRGINAIGLSGMDAQIWQGTQKSAIPVMENGRKRILRGNLTGKVTHVNADLLRQLLDQGLLPVICPPAITESGQGINVDGDRAAATTAACLGASELIILSNVPGVMKNIEDDDSRIDHIALADLETVSSNFAQGRMRIKLLAAREALEEGVGRVVIGDARIDRCLSRAAAGEGTVISSNPDRVSQ